MGYYYSWALMGYYYSWALMGYYSWALVSDSLFWLENEV